MNKYRLIVTIRGWMNEQRNKNTEYTEKEIFYFNNIEESLDKLSFIDFNRQEFTKGRNAEIINFKIEMISLIKDLDLTKL